MNKFKKIDNYVNKFIENKTDICNRKNSLIESVGSVKNEMANKKKNIYKKVKKTKETIYKTNMIWSIVSLIIFIVYTIISFANNMVSKFYLYLFVSILSIYIIIFTIFIIVNRKDRKKLKLNIKNLKSASKTLKNIFFITNSILILIMFISSFNVKDVDSYFKLIFMIISISMASFSIFFEIIKIVFRQIKKVLFVKKNQNRIINTINKRNEDKNLVIENK